VLYVPGDHTLQPRPAHHAPKWLPGLYVRRVAKGMPTAKESR
jgi:hypothetical protein